MNRDRRIQERQRLSSRRRSGEADVVARIGASNLRASCTGDATPGLTQTSGTLSRRLGCSGFGRYMCGRRCTRRRGDYLGHAAHPVISRGCCADRFRAARRVGARIAGYSVDFRRHLVDRRRRSIPPPRTMVAARHRGHRGGAGRWRARRPWSSARAWRRRCRFPGP